MALLGFVFATIFAWVWLQMIEYFESDTKTENNPESNPQPYQKQVPTTDMQETTGKTRIIPLPIMWEPEKGSVSYNTASLDHNTEKTTVDVFLVTPAITVEYVKNLENDNQNLINEIGICQQRFQYVSAGVEEMVDEKERLQEEVKSLKETLAKYESDNRNQEKPNDSDERKQLRDENSNLKTELEMSARTVSFQSEEIQNLVDTTNELNKKLKSTFLKNDELILKLATSRDMASKEKVAADESDSKKSQPQDLEKPDDTDELMKHLKDENSNLKTNLEASACMMSFQSEEIQQLTARTNELNKKLQRVSSKNDELILKLATSRDRALTITDGFHEIESKLKKEITELKNQLNSKQQLLEKTEATLESTLQAQKVAVQKDEDIHKSKLELKLVHQKNLVLTSLNDQLQNELNELKRIMGEIRAEFRLLSEARDGTSLSAEVARNLADEAIKLADERAAVNVLLQTNVTELKKQISAFKSQIDALKKEKSAQLYNASTWAATESQLQNEIVNLKVTLQTQNETLSLTTSELERIKHDDSFLNLSLESVKAMLAEKLTENNDLTIRNSDLESDNFLLELNNDNLKKEAEDCRIKLERMERVNQDLWDTREAVLQSAQKSEKLAEEQVEALSEALAALQEAIKHTKEAAKATKTEHESMNSRATKTEAADQKKDNTWIKKLIAKCKTRESQYEDGYANLLETTGLNMVERAKKLQRQADNIKAKGKALKKKAQALSRK